MPSANRTSPWNGTATPTPEFVLQTWTGADQSAHHRTKGGSSGQQRHPDMPPVRRKWVTKYAAYYWISHIPALDLFATGPGGGSFPLMYNQIRLTMQR